jgi:predicted Zn-dependent protease
MKSSHALAAVIAVLLGACLASPAVAQDNTQSQPSTPSTVNSTSTTQGTDAQAQDAAPAPTDAPANTTAAATAPKETHNKSINDIDDIGDRKVGNTGKSIGNWYSIDTDVKLGKQYAMMVESSARMVQDPVVIEYVNRIGQNLVRNSDAKVPFTIKVVDSDDINAFALPGGFFYVNSGLILAADDEAELAGVMAHEIAHVAARHQTREMTRANYVSFASVPLIFVGSWGVYEAANAAMSLALPITFMKFQRGFESEADYLGLQYMYKAGYDPQAFISFFEKIQALEKRKPGLVAKAFSDHPQTPDRILHSQEEIARILPAKDEYTVTTSEFEDVKARLARIENKRRLTDTKDKSKPSLRRASTSGDPNAQGTDSGDDRPTLHRREDQQQ